LLWRRDLVASAADEIAGRAAQPIRFFAAACGHLRECDRMRSLKDGRVAKIVAFDMDAENLEGVRRDYANEPIAAHQGSVRQLVEGRHLFADMDLVHAGALMEGLPDAPAAELARALFALLRPGGTLILANLLEGLPDAGYVEAYMDWRITYRTPQSIEALASDIDSGAIDDITYVQDTDATIGAIAVTRR
jgi:SAM-dependent methyltransferase